MPWFELKGDERINERCASENCPGQPTWRLEADGVGSNFCSGCKEHIENTCDCCGKTMRHTHLGVRSVSRLFVCQDCRGEGMKRLGRDGVTALHVGFAVGQH